MERNIQRQQPKIEFAKPMEFGKSGKSRIRTAQTAPPPAEQDYEVQLTKNDDSVMMEKISRYTQALEQLKQTKTAGNPYEDFSKALRIALRIMTGESVNKNDRRFLAEKFPDLLHKAEMMRMHKERQEKNPKSIAEEDWSGEGDVESIQKQIDKANEMMKALSGDAGSGGSESAASASSAEA